MAGRATKPLSKRIGPSQFNAKRLGAAIQILREGRGLNPSQFAKLSGLTRQAVAVLEKGSVEPTISTLEKVAGATGLTVIDVVAMGIGANDPTAPKIQSMLGIARKLDDRSLDLAVSLLAALAKHHEG